MRKIAVTLAIAVTFDLGSFVVSSQAAVDMFLKLEGIEGEAACKLEGGTVVLKSGGKLCRKTVPGPTVASPGPTVASPGPTVASPGPSVGKAIPARGTATAAPKGN